VQESFYLFGFVSRKEEYEMHQPIDRKDRSFGRRAEEFLYLGIMV
jgi:hypothetical protein